ncbi:uncharacterized protein I303_102508 [Kwoniella dejecticola CBS 10117]|uniref:Uncharacterized protein n=1 Tax=Kwoniella dejecticola CBS 10117 TaxID=1296121 RepID=A0A1A6A8Y2_9TREE|nr:uncharacterized protein I303_02522 [Kwoniella dejecticola CBS 10117]OBR86514.1 hypothetical protein I303_02522 [Kwoniella dejecticola CBS 10117]
MTYKPSSPPPFAIRPEDRGPIVSNMDPSSSHSHPLIVCARTEDSQPHSQPHSSPETYVKSSRQLQDYQPHNEDINPFIEEQDENQASTKHQVEKQGIQSGTDVGIDEDHEPVFSDIKQENPSPSPSPTEIQSGTTSISLSASTSISNPKPKTKEEEEHLHLSGDTLCTPSKQHRRLPKFDSDSNSPQASDIDMDVDVDVDGDIDIDVEKVISAFDNKTIENINEAGREDTLVARLPSPPTPVPIPVPVPVPSGIRSPFKAIRPSITPVLRWTSLRLYDWTKIGSPRPEHGTLPIGSCPYRGAIQTDHRLTIPQYREVFKDDLHLDRCRLWGDVDRDDRDDRDHEVIYMGWDY